MSTWTVEFEPAARREYTQLEEGPRRSAASVIAEQIEEGPELSGAILRRGYRDTWRVRFHNDRFRMVFEAFRKRRQIIVIRIRPRSTAYRGLRNGG